MTTECDQLARAFIKNYYSDLVAGDMAQRLRYYGEVSSISFADNGEAEARHVRGKAKIQKLLEDLHEMLGPCKVNVRNADFVTADVCVAVTCSGHIYTLLRRRVFTQTFVLAPTANRENCFFISGETLRFLSDDVETVPPGSTLSSLAEFTRFQTEATEMQKAAEMEEAKVVKNGKTHQPRERPPRKEPVRKEAAAELTAVPLEEAADQDAVSKDPAIKGKAPARRQKALNPRHTNKVRVLSVPKVVKLSAMRRAASNYGEVLDAFWLDDIDCVVEFATTTAARDMFRDADFYKSVTRAPLKIEYFQDDKA